MMKRLKAISAIAGLLLLASPNLARPAHAQANQSQQLAFAGLHATGAQGQFNSVKTDASGNLYLLLDQKDGVRVLKTDNAGNAILAQALLGAKGDIGLAMALDPAGNVYVTGTTTSTTLTGTGGAAIPARTDASTNSFVAKFDPSLNPIFVTFTGGSRIAASAIAATADAVFVTGSLFSATLPVTSVGFQQTPASGSFQNGFVERFSADGSTLVYATYLTGTSGDTTPTAITADSLDNAYLAGATTASGFPTAAALVPAMVANPSGFLTRLAPAGDGLIFSTFIPGQGLSSVALDTTGQTLLVSGSVALGQFPVSTPTQPLLPLNYQVLLHLPLDGSAVQSSTIIAPGQQSYLAPAPDGSVWIDGTFTAPLLPSPALATLGGAYAVHVTLQNTIDQTARFGGLPNAGATYASLPAIITSIAIDPAGEPLIAGSVQPTASSALLATETYDLPLVNNLTTALPSTIRAAEVTAATCNGSLCSGSAAYLAKLNIATSAPSLVFSADDSPWLILRNLGSAQTTNLQLSTTADTLATNCPTTLSPGGECDMLLTGSAAATITATASNAASQSVTAPALTAPTSTIVFAPKELDFGLQPSANPPGTRTITVSNLGTASQTFTSSIDSSAKTASPFTEQSSDCPINGDNSIKLLTAGATCHITLALTASTSSANDGLLSADWSIGSRDVVLTGYSQAASLSVSASELDFGTQYPNGMRLPRSVFLSNSSSVAIAHATATLPASSPFTVIDSCPTTIAAGTVCGIRIDYLSATVPSKDTATLTLDQGLSVLLTGQTLAQPPAGGGTSSTLSVSPSSVTFATSVVVTGVSDNNQTLSVINSSSASIPITLAIIGDFTQVNSCGTSLPGGQTCAIAISFAPSQPGVRQGLLSLGSGTGINPIYVSLSGTATAIVPVSNGVIAFGNQPVGQPAAQFFKVAQAFTSLSATASGPYKLAFIADLGYGPGQPPSSAYTSTVTGACAACYLAVQFQPTAAGAQSGSLTLSSNAAGVPYTLSLTGTGLPLTGLLLSPLTQDFGSIPVHNVSGAGSFTLTNQSVSGAIVTIPTPTVTGDFALSPNAGCGTSLAPTASCTFSLSFSPTATGARTGSLTFTSSDGNVTATLTGYGLPDPGIAINPLALTFANVTGPTATQQTVTLTNTDNVALQIGAPTLATSSFLAANGCSSLAIEANCTIAITFLPGTAPVLDSLTIPVTRAGSTSPVLYSVALSGAYTLSTAALQIAPSQTDFGPTAIATQGPIRQFTLNNLTAKSLSLNLIIPRQFALSGTPCLTLAPSTSCTIQLQFDPLTNADITGTLTAQATPSDGSAPSQAMAYLEGFGTSQGGTLSITGSLQTGSILNFGQVTSGQTLARTLTLVNTSAASAVIMRRITSGPPFLSTTTCTTPLAAGQSCSVTLTYAPSNQVATGTASPASTSDSGLLTIESDASSSPDLIHVIGQAGPLVVSNPSGSTPLATYTLSQSSFAFAQAQMGTATASQGVILTNTGSIALHVLSATTTADFTTQNGCATILPAATCTLTVAFTPQTTGTHVSALEIATDSTTSLEFISLIGTATASPVSLSPTSLDFGPLVVGVSTTLPIQITNSGSTAATITASSITGDYTQAGTCPPIGSPIPANSSCTLQVTFKPTQTGARPGTLSLTTNASTIALTASLTGTGIQSLLTSTPASLAFGNTTLGSSANMTLTLANIGTAPVTNIATTISGDYTITKPCTASSLAPNTNCQIQVTFTPTAIGLWPGTLTITSSDHSSPLLIPLSGTGIQLPSFTLTANGASSATATVSSGTPATYALAVTPIAGFTGPMALTCASVVPGLYATCSIQPSILTLAGSAQNSTVTINTITTRQAHLTPTPTGTLLCILIPGLAFLWKRRRTLRQRATLTLLALSLTAFMITAGGCGGSAPAKTSNTQTTPPGTYQYQVTATSTSGTQITQTVTLNLTVQ